MQWRRTAYVSQFAFLGDERRKGRDREEGRERGRGLSVCAVPLGTRLHTCSFSVPFWLLWKSRRKFRAVFFLQKPKTEKSKEPLCFSASRTSSQPRRHGTKEQPHRRKMSLAFDEFGRPFIIIKVRNPPLWAAPFTRSLCSQRIKKDFRSKNNLLRDLSPIVACTKR
jgi:hypothetical protein